MECHSIQIFRTHGRERKTLFPVDPNTAIFTPDFNKVEGEENGSFLFVVIFLFCRLFIPS